MKKRLSEDMEMFLRQSLLKLEGGEKTITIGGFMDSISRRGFGAALLLLSLPAAVPLPAVGYATPFGLLIILLGLQLLMGRSSPWLPDRISRKHIPPGFIAFLREKGLPFLKKGEKWSAKRMEFMTQRGFRPLVGLSVLLMGAIMAIPLPLTNTLPAMVVFILSLGLTSDDGLLILIGLASSVILLIAYLTIIIFGVQLFFPRPLSLSTPLPLCT